MSPRRVVLGVVGVAGAVVLAEVVSRGGLVDETALPPASTVLAEAGRLAVDGEFLVDVGATLTAWAGGLALAVLVAVPLGVLLGSVPFLGTAARALVELLRPVPSVALIPLAIILFGDPTRMKMSLIFYACLWPILINTLYALRDVDPVARDSLRAFGFGPVSVLWRVSLPSAAPFVATGVRIAASVALIVGISTELLAGGVDGVGIYLASTQAGGGRNDLLLAGAVWAGVLGLAVNGALRGLERVAFRWHTARVEGIA
ncbi:NitT/TauT family transport system permease protein [Actinomadura pelletieri DSM 43383]|uniref:NitT/TauT family transport system permease protein n=1 Tax=Actinomadura pelletieri DSM 43383 TaxID=1120940 RepID=A0A495QB79_9ACTN|nr:ABC transporter permease [Actinomadura pelletieri]RKS68940.1 NitT/TauT family transport system permease protein [Actinomadura pelletieri DSM 43383]